MRILQPDNTSFLMNSLPETEDDLRYCVLDYSDKDNVDWYFVPLVFVETYPRPSADCRIGPYRVQIPLDWSIAIGDKNNGAIEIIDPMQFNDRPFTAFIMNPLDGFMPSFEEITVENIFPNVTWTLPKLKYGHLLAVPLTSGPKPPCIIICRDVNRIPDTLDITKVF